MRWITFFILLYLMASLQAAHFGGIPHANSSWPEIQYLSLLAIFYALFAMDAAAPLAALACGAMIDLGNYPTEILGTSLVPLALVAFLVVKIRLSIFREHILSQMLVTLLALLAYALLSIIFRAIVRAPFEGHSAWTLFGILTGNAFYTAILAPVFFWLFFRFPTLLGFTSHGPRARGKA